MRLKNTDIFIILHKVINIFNVSSKIVKNIFNKNKRKSIYNKNDRTTYISLLLKLNDHSSSLVG